MSVGQAGLGEAVAWGLAAYGARVIVSSRGAAAQKYSTAASAFVTGQVLHVDEGITAGQ